MKRDMELVRKILFAMEENEKLIYYSGQRDLRIEGFSQPQVDYHFKIMAQAGLLHTDSHKLSAPILEGFTTPKNEYVNYSISWQGHEFLAAAKNENFWKKAEVEIARVMGGTGRIMLPVLTQLLTSYVKAELKLP